MIFKRCLSRVLYSDHAHRLMELSKADKFTPYFIKQFKDCDNAFDLVRLLNNAFSHDIVPPAAVVEEVLASCRKLNQYGLAVRTLEGLKDKCNSSDPKLYKQRLGEVEATLKELGVEPIEVLGKLEQ